MASFVPKLYYFDIPGKGEAIRLACAFSGYVIEDIRLSRDEMLAMKEAGKLAYGQLPVFEVEEGVYISQSAAIMRYIGKKTGLYPSDHILAALVDSVIDEEIDLFTGLAVSRYQGRFGFGILTDRSDLVASVRQSLNDEVIPRHLRCLENLLEKSPTGWVAGTTDPSIADFILVPRLQWLSNGDHEGISKDILSPFPFILAMMDKLLNLPPVVEYYTRH